MNLVKALRSGAVGGKQSTCGDELQGIEGGFSPLRYRTWFRLPYVARILLDRPVARELARIRNIQNGCASPRTRIGIQLAQLLVRFEIGPEVRQVHVVVSAR